MPSLNLAPVKDKKKPYFWNRKFQFFFTCEVIPNFLEIYILNLNARKRIVFRTRL